MKDLKLRREQSVSLQSNIPVKKWQRTANFLTGTLSAPALATLFARKWWIADLIANLRVQLVLGMLGAMSILIITRRWKSLATMMALTIWQALALQSAFIPPVTTQESSARGGESVGKGSQQTLRVLLANVLTRNPQHDQIVEQIRSANPDVFAILELNSALNERIRQEFGTTHQFVVAETQDNGNFGIGLWSRSQMTDARLFHLNAADIPSIEADVPFGSYTIRIVATHPLPPVGARNFAHRNRHLSLLAERFNKNWRQNPGQPTLLLGDLNLTPWSPGFEDFLEASNLRNSAEGCGLEPTWYRWPAFPFGLVLDHGLISESVECTQRTILPPNGSDHRAVVFDFALNGSR